MIQTDSKMLDAMQHGAGMVTLEQQTAIEMTGADRTKHLNGFCTADINRLQPGDGCEAFVLNIKGKVLGFVSVFCQADSLLLVSVPGQAEKLIAHLDRYVIREDVVFADRTESMAVFSVSGLNARQCLLDSDAELPESLYSHIETQIRGSAVVIARTNIVCKNEYWVFGEAEQQDVLRKAIIDSGACDCDCEAYEAARINAAYPRYGVDVSEENLPQEVDRNSLAISFTKGCYLGQETVARLDALGHVNKILRRFVFDGVAEIESGSELFDSDETNEARKKIGNLTSVCQSATGEQTICLGYVKTKFAKANSEMFVGSAKGLVDSV